MRTRILPKIENIKLRSTKSEILDEQDFEREELKDILGKIALVNKLLGGNSITINALKRRIGKQVNKDEILIVDVGCGGGDMCRSVAKYFLESQYNIRIIGVDIDEQSLSIARELTDDSRVTYENIDVFCNDFVDLNPDFVISTLTFHHFSDMQIVEIMNNCLRVPRVSIIVNDLHRSSWAFYLFIPLSYLFGMGHCNRHDGLISILRGFKKSNLQGYIENIKRTNSEVKTNIQWKWAFRYLWTIDKI